MKIDIPRSERARKQPKEGSNHRTSLIPLPKRFRLSQHKADNPSSAFRILIESLRSLARDKSLGERLDERNARLLSKTSSLVVDQFSNLIRAIYESDEFLGCRGSEQESITCSSKVPSAKRDTESDLDIFS